MEAGSTVVDDTVAANSGGAYEVAGIQGDDTPDDGTGAHRVDGPQGAWKDAHLYPLRQPDVHPADVPVPVWMRPDSTDVFR